MDNKDVHSIQENNLYKTILILGIVFVVIAYFLKDPNITFFHNLLLNLGCNMIVVSLVFMIYRMFNRASRVPDEYRDKLSEFASPAPRKAQRKYRDEGVRKK